MPDYNSYNREITFTLESLSDAASEFIEATGAKGIFLFDGEMGAGKTTFIAEVCRQLGVSDDCGSPTFSLVNEYLDSRGNPVYHFDLYRIESPAEAFDMGAEDYFDSGALCLVEWPDRLGAFTPENASRVKLTINPDDSRKISF